MSNKIKELREAAGMSQAKLAEKMGVAQTTIASWETGERNPKKKNIMALAEAFGIDVMELLKIYVAV